MNILRGKLRVGRPLAVVVLLASGAGAYKVGTEDNRQDGEHSRPVREAAHGSPGETTNPAKVTPCWISRSPGPSGYPELIVGSSWGLLQATSPVAVVRSDIVWNGLPSADCSPTPTSYSLPADAGTVQAGSTFFVRLDSWYVSDAHFNLGATATRDFTLSIIGGNTCIPAPMWSGWQRRTRTFAPAQEEWSDDYRWNTSAPGPITGPPGSGTGFLVTAPTLGAYRSLRITLTTTVTPSAGYPPAVDTEDVCIKFQGGV